jgi:hypothetical protein
LEFVTIAVAAAVDVAVDDAIVGGSVVTNEGIGCESKSTK